MDKNQFILNYRNAFGNYELPIGIWYSDEPIVEPVKTRGCFIKDIKPAREGQIISLNIDCISCPGGKVYTGFMQVPPFLPGFVSDKERYKDTPSMVTEFLTDLNIPNKSGKYINFASIENIDNFEGLEGVIFFATPDVMTGLVSWTLLDTNKPDAVSVPFASGCSAVIAQTIVENRDGGHRAFLGLFDPSVRPQIESNILSLAIPMSRFKEMYYTFAKSCLQGTRAWVKVKERIEKDGICN
jgi:hypothetical protein